VGSTLLQMSQRVPNPRKKCVEPMSSSSHGGMKPRRGAQE